MAKQASNISSGISVKSLNWFHWLELGIFLYFIFAPGFTKYLGYDTSGGIERIIGGMINAVFLLVIYVPFRVYLGRNDYRLKIIYHILILTVSMVFSITLRDEAILKGNTSGIKDVIFVYGPLLVLIFAILKSIFAINQPFISEFSRVNDNVTNNNLDTRILDADYVKDTFFGPISQFTNSILDTLETNIDNIYESQEFVTNASEKLAVNTEELNASAEEVSSTMQSVAVGANHQTEAISNVDIIMEQFEMSITAIIAEINNNIERTSQIALQTNILALNAGIEASRAGDYGRGFAVVAENVRKLSEEVNNSQKQTSLVVKKISEELESLLNTLRKEIESVISVAEEASASTEEVVAAVEEMTASIQEISQLASEMMSDMTLQTEKIALLSTKGKNQKN